MKQQQPQQQVGTIVGSSVHLTGTIKDSSDITIFGSVEGDINSDQKIVIEESAQVKGPVTAAEVVVSGMVKGTINAKKRLELNPTGTIKGNIETQEILIHSGATFIGKCLMPDESEGKDTSLAQDQFEAEDEEEKEGKDKEGEESREPSEGLEEELDEDLDEEDEE